MPADSAEAPLIVPAKSVRESAATVETLTPTFLEHRPFISPARAAPGLAGPFAIWPALDGSPLPGRVVERASLPASRSIASNSAQMRSRKVSNQAARGRCKGSSRS
jgi:hypothetical protein